MSDEKEVSYRKLAAFVGAFVGSLGVSFWGMYYQPGPWWLWASDACPDPATTCGMMPMGPVVSGVAGFAIISLSAYLSIGGVEKVREVAHA